MNTCSPQLRRMVAACALVLPLLTTTFVLVALTMVPLYAQAQSPARIAEVMPAFPGGPDALSTYIAKNVSYPEAAKAAHAEGTVYVHFVVATDGTLGDVKVPRPVNPDLEAEAMRVVKAMPNWSPGMQGGKAVPVLMTLPVTFTLAGTQ